MSYIDLQDLRAQSRSFESIAAYKMNGFTLLHQEQAERVQGMRVTAKIGRQAVYDQPFPPS